MTLASAIPIDGRSAIGIFNRLMLTESQKIEFPTTFLLSRISTVRVRPRVFGYAVREQRMQLCHWPIDMETIFGQHRLPEIRLFQLQKDMTTTLRSRRPWRSHVSGIGSISAFSGKILCNEQPTTRSSNKLRVLISFNSFTIS